jgi:hypothetical protein
MYFIPIVSYFQKSRQVVVFVDCAANLTHRRSPTGAHWPSARHASTVQSSFNPPLDIFSYQRSPGTSSSIDFDRTVASYERKHPSTPLFDSSLGMQDDSSHDDLVTFFAIL